MEEQGLALNDGTTKVFLSTKGTENDVDKPLQAFLDYVDGKKTDDELVQEIDDEVGIARRCEDWRREYMTMEMEIRRRERNAKAEGKIKAVKELIKAGLTTLAAVKASGLYTETELSAIAAP